MDQIQEFVFEGHGVRTVIFNEEPWFVAKDVAEVLGYVNTTDAITAHCKGVAKRYPLQTAGGIQETRIIHEADVWRLVMHSKLPGAQKFENWIMEEVIPSIRKNGGYLSPTVDFSDPDNIQKILDAWKVDRKKLEEAKSTIVSMQPAHDFGKTLLDAVDTYFPMNEAAKILEPETGMGRNILFSWLRDKKILRENNTPYQNYINDGYFRVTEKPTAVGPKAVTMVSNRGIDYIRKLFKKDNEE